MRFYKSSEFNFSAPKIVFAPQKIYVSPLNIYFEQLLIDFCITRVVPLESFNVTTIVTPLILIHILEVLFSGLSDLLVDFFLLPVNASIYHFYKISIPLIMSVGYHDLRIRWA